MASPSVDPDIEGQPYRFAETQDAIILDPLPPPITITENLQLPTSAVPRHQATDANEHYDGNTPARQTVADNSQVQRGMLTFPLHQSQSHSYVRREPRRLFRWALVDVPH